MSKSSTFKFLQKLLIRIINPSLNYAIQTLYLYLRWLNFPLFHIAAGMFVLYGHREHKNKILIYRMWKCMFHYLAALCKSAWYLSDIIYNIVHLKKKLWCFSPNTVYKKMYGLAKEFLFLASDVVVGDFQIITNSLW